MSKILIGFDFSINKPACTILKDDKLYFYIWPLNLSKNEVKKYTEADSVSFYNRDLEPISKKSKYTSTELAFEHTKRSVDLANKIVEDISQFIGTDDLVYIASEGLSFASAGNSNLDLATYKGVLLAKIYESLNPMKILTYAPITIKKVAGVDKKSDFLSKTPMIDHFKQEPYLEGNKFQEQLCFGDVFLAKTNYIHCIDDIVDSYYACKTMYIKEKMNHFEPWNG